LNLQAKNASEKRRKRVEKINEDLDLDHKIFNPSSILLARHPERSEGSVVNGQILRHLPLADFSE
jgi:hypothetical protein